MTRVVAIVPAKDRADNVAATVTALRGLDEVDRILVVDDGSTDATAEEARRAGARVLQLGANRGKAGAIAAGIEIEADAEVYLLIDADVGDDARHARALLEPVLADELDLAIGVLPAAGRRGGFGMIRRLAHWGVRKGSGFEARAPLSGQRAVRGRFLRDLSGVTRFGLEVAMTIDAARAGARVGEVDVPMEHRHTGRTVAGFRHRGAQGRDVIEALWPRLCPRGLRRSLAVLLFVAFVGASFLTSRATAVSSVPATAHARHVVIVGVPHLGLGDLDTAKMPHLMHLVDVGATGMMTPHTGGGSRSSAAYATLGAGAPVNASDSAGQVADRYERVEGSPAIDVLERRTGRRPSGRVVVPSMPSVERSAGTYVDSKPGSLADALHHAGLKTGVVANSDSVTPDNQPDRSAPAAIAAASSAGTVDVGTVSPKLLRKDPNAPFGLTMDLPRFLRAFESVAHTRGLVVVDAGETDRANLYRGGASQKSASRMLETALARTDQLIGAISSHLAPDTLLIVAGMTPPGGQPELVPIVAAGAGVVPGHLESPSTDRQSLVTLTDLAPTVLASLGAQVPADMVGQPLRYARGTTDVASLQATNQLTIDRDGAYGGLLNSFVYVQIALYVIALVALLRPDTPSGMKRFLQFCLLTVTVVPLMTFLFRVVPALGSLGSGTVALLWAASALVAWFGRGRGRTALSPLVAVAAANLVVICGDVALGATLQESSLLGYSPTVAARFVGIGNAAYAILAASMIIVMVWIVDRSVRPRDAWWSAALVGAIVIVVDGAPWLGSDVGGILSLVPAVGITLYLLSGRRLNWKAVAVPAVAAIALLGAVIGYEALQPATRARSHR